MVLLGLRLYLECLDISRQMLCFPCGLYFVFYTPPLRKHLFLVIMLFLMFCLTKVRGCLHAVLIVSFQRSPSMIGVNYFSDETWLPFWIRLVIPSWPVELFPSWMQIVLWFPFVLNNIHVWQRIWFQQVNMNNRSWSFVL